MDTFRPGCELPNPFLFSPNSLLMWFCLRKHWPHAVSGHALEPCVQVLSSCCPLLVLWPRWRNLCPSLVLLSSSRIRNSCSCLPGVFLLSLAALANPESSSCSPNSLLLGFSEEKKGWHDSRLLLVALSLPDPLGVSGLTTRPDSGRPGRVGLSGRSGRCPFLHPGRCSRGECNSHPKSFLLLVASCYY